MPDQPANGTPPVPAQWQEILALLEGNLRAAAESLKLLRISLGEAPAAPSRPPRPEGEVPSTALPSLGTLPAEKDRVAPDAFDRLWERLEHERLERAEAEPEPAEPLTVEERIAARLPQQYVITVEDHERHVDLVQLQRALLRVADMDDVSLVSFLNGTAVVSVRVKGGLDLEKLERSLVETLDAACELSAQDNRVRIRLFERTKEAS